MEVDIQGRPIPIHLQLEVEKVFEKLKKQRHIEEINNVDAKCFVSPTVITIKYDQSVEIALDSLKLDKKTVKRKPRVLNMEVLISKMFSKVADGPADEIWTSQ